MLGKKKSFLLLQVKVLFKNFRDSVFFQPCKDVKKLVNVSTCITLSATNVLVVIIRDLYFLKHFLLNVEDFGFQMLITEGGRLVIIWDLSLISEETLVELSRLQKATPTNIRHILESL